MSDDLNKERNRLNRIIRDKKDEIENLESRVSDLRSLKITEENEVNALTESKGALETEIVNLNENKDTLNNFVSENSTKKTSLETNVQNLSNQKETLESFIATNNPVKESLESEIEGLQSDKETLSNENSELSSNSTTLKSDIINLKTEKISLEESTKELREKFGLYSKDMKDMSIDSKSQLKKYSWIAFFSIATSIALMCWLLDIVLNENPFNDKLMAFFYHQPNYRFYSILTIRISISAIFIFLIIIFLNLSRGFISQYIKARNRLTALRVTDFLLERIQTKEGIQDTESDIIELQTERIKEQVQLLNTHLPKLMDLGSSSFDKNSKTENPLNIIKEIKEIVKNK